MALLSISKSSTTLRFPRICPLHVLTIRLTLLRATSSTAPTGSSPAGAQHGGMRGGTVRAACGTTAICSMSSLPPPPMAPRSARTRTRYVMDMHSSCFVLSCFDALRWRGERRANGDGWCASRSWWWACVIILSQYVSYQIPRYSLTSLPTSFTALSH